MALRVKFRTQFPAVVTATSPITLAKSGVSYTFGLNITALSSSLAASATIDATNADNITAGSQTGTGAMVRATAPSLVGGTHVAITSFGIRSTGSAFDLTFANTEVLTAGRTLTVTLNNAARTLNMGGNITTGGALTTSGAFASTFTMTGTTTITFPTAGTLATLAGSETFTNKTISTTGTGNHIQIGSVDITQGQILGEASTGNASAGNIGEYIESVLVSGSATALTTTTAKTIASITLSAGDWDVTCSVGFLPAATTSTTDIIASISLATNTLDATIGRASSQHFPAVVTGGAVFALPVMTVRLSLSGSTSVFMVGQATFTVSTMGGYGIIRARRVR